MKRQSKSFDCMYKIRIETTGEKSVRPMNDYQRNILNMEYCFPGTAVANIGGILRADVPFDYEQCVRIVREVVEKTDALQLRLNDRDELYQYKEENYTLDRVVIDGDSSAADAYARKKMSTPFDSIYDHRLFLFEYLEYRGGCGIFLRLHHLLGDAASVAWICKKVDDGYRCLQQGKEHLCDSKDTIYPELTMKEREAAASYFEEKQVTKEVPCIGERESKDCSADRVKFSLPVYKKNMSADFVLALYLYLSALTNSSRVALGFVFGNRSRNEMDMFGMFANTLPLILELPEGTYEELREQVKKEIMGLMRHSRYTLEQLRKEQKITRRLFEISVSYRYRGFVPKMKMGEVQECFNGCVDVPMRINIEEKSEEIFFDITYQKAVFSKEYVLNMGEAIKNIISQGVGCPQSTDMVFLTAKDKKLYQQLNNTLISHKYNDVVSCFFENISEEECLVWEDGSITATELARRSSGIAAFIREKKAGIVGLRMERSHEMIECVLGVLMAGAAFGILSDAAESMESYCDLILEKEDVETLYMDTTLGENQYKAWKERQYDSESTAYLICTSGTTGGPKCIKISRGGLMSRLEWADRCYGLKGSILQKTINTFDVSVWEMLSVVFGARLCLLRAGEEKLPDKIAQAMAGYGIEKVHFVPSILQRFLSYVTMHSCDFSSLKEVYVSGEKLEKATAERFFEVLPGVRLINYYGPAECTIDVTSYECIPGKLPAEDIPIGTPADNTQIVIMNEKNQILPVGALGEICIFGELVGKGYLGMKHERFCEIGGRRAYKTGDLGKIGFDGNIYIYGRNDQQVKLRGIRVNLSEIKNAALRCEGVSAAEIIKHGNRLECFYTGNVHAEAVRKGMADKLPAYAVPSLYHLVERIPLNANGKADMVALLELCQKSSESERTDSQKKEMVELSGLEREILEEVSKHIQAGLRDNLFDLGLDSISVLDIVCSLQEKGYQITFSDFYENLSVHCIAQNIHKKTCYTYLRKADSKDVMIIFPYGGGEPQNFSKLASHMNCDVIAVYPSSFPAESTMEELAAELAETLPLEQYGKVYLYGHCVGCMLAAEFAVHLKREVAGMIFVAPSWKKKAAQHSPWKYLPDGVISLVLRLAGSKPKSSGKSSGNAIKYFRKDTNRFFWHELPEQYLIRIEQGISVFFGTRDVFTWNSKKILRSLQESFSAEVSCTYIKGGNHFMNEENSEELSGKIQEYMK